MHQLYKIVFSSYSDLFYKTRSFGNFLLSVNYYPNFIIDSGYLHNGRADKNPYPHDRHADKDSYPHNSNNQCIILRLQLSFMMINVQLMLG